MLHPLPDYISASLHSMFWVVIAGLFLRASPYRAGNCDRHPDFPAQFRGDCSKLVALDALAWILCKLEKPKTTSPCVLC